MKTFDSVCLKEIFEKCSEGHFSNLSKYPHASRVEFDEISRYWRSIQIDAVTKEIKMIDSFMSKFT